MTALGAATMDRSRVRINKCRVHRAAVSAGINHSFKSALSVCLPGGKIAGHRDTRSGSGGRHWQRVAQPGQRNATGPPIARSRHDDNPDWQRGRTQNRRDENNSSSISSNLGQTEGLESDPGMKCAATVAISSRPRPGCGVVGHVPRYRWGLGASLGAEFRRGNPIRHSPSAARRDLLALNGGKY